MKKLKIFLLLSILLCFGFALSTEVHAQGGGPKIFEVGDILPATTQLKISWISFESTQLWTEFISTSTDNDFISEWEDTYFCLDVNGETVIWNKKKYPAGSVIIDTSSWSEESRTITFVNSSFSSVFTWEDLNAPPAPSGPKIFEVGDVLPAGYIKISWDFTGKPMAVNGDFLISSDGDFTIRIWEFGNITLFINDEMFYADTPGNTIITLTESVTITDMDGYDDYYEYIHGALFWEVVSEDYINGFMEAREIYGFNMGGYWISGEQAWNNGYDLGSELAWEEGFEYGMEIYGYYDPITEQWLSVEEYINLYGTDKMNQSDFYNNFDKYFIPAMIIVFGGAIVLTILKVFKGRE